ncbi:MAG: aminotransferase class V-fold PLP-dependent enzyme, partial [Thermoleophilia bacterium]|nr:aminotransferase class V-fold PLP-dependent enzyme [Thermoleophilia bacterium]
MDVHDYSPSPTARRFESGTPPIPAIYAGIAGIELMLQVGVEETRAHVQELNHRLLEGLEELGAQLATPRKRDRRGALICVRSTDAPALVAALRREGIVTSSRDSNLRISAHCYNAVEDVDAVLDALRRNRSLLVPAA